MKNSILSFLVSCALISPFQASAFHHHDEHNDQQENIGHHHYYNNDQDGQSGNTQFTAVPANTSQPPQQEAPVMISSIPIVDLLYSTSIKSLSLPIAIQELNAAPAILPGNLSTPPDSNNSTTNNPGTQTTQQPGNSRTIINTRAIKIAKQDSINPQLLVHIDEESIY